MISIFDLFSARVEFNGRQLYVDIFKFICYTESRKNAGRRTGGVTLYIIKKNCRIPMYEIEAFAEYLSDMSAKGWRFVESDAEDPDPIPYRRKLIFESLHDKRLYYGIGALDEEDYEKRGQFIASCEKEGWRFVSIIGKLYVFCSESSHLPPIPSDKNIEAEIMESLKPMPMPDNYQIFLTIAFIIAAALSINVYNDDILAFYTTNFLLMGWAFILAAMIATVVGRMFMRIRYKKACEMVESNQTPNKKGYQAAVLKKKVLYTLSGLLFVPAAAMILIRPGAFSYSDTYISNKSNNIKLSNIIKADKQRTESGSYRMSIFADYDYYYQENLPIDDSAQPSSSGNAANLPSIVKPTSSDNARITVINYKFSSEKIARDVYARDKTYNLTDKNQKDELPSTAFTEEECQKMKIDMGRYYYIENSGFLEIIMLDGDTYTIIYCNHLGGFSEKIADAIAKR